MMLHSSNALYVNKAAQNVPHSIIVLKNAIQLCAKIASTRITIVYHAMNHNRSIEKKIDALMSVVYNLGFTKTKRQVNALNAKITAKYAPITKNAKNVKKDTSYSKILSQNSHNAQLIVNLLKLIVAQHCLMMSKQELVGDVIKVACNA